jgi:integrase
MKQHSGGRWGVVTLGVEPMTTKRPAARRSAALYRTGEKGRNRVNLVRRKSGLLALEWFEGGQRLERSLGHRDLTRGKAEADRLAAELAAGRHGKTGEAVTLAELFDKYAREVTPSKSPGKQAHDRAVAALVCRVLGPATRADSLSRSDAARVIAARQRAGDRRLGKVRGTPLRSRAIQYDLVHLRAVLRWGVHQGLLDRNPLPPDVVPRGNQPRQPRLGPAEYRRLLEVAPEVMPLALPLLVTVYETGHRIGAVRSLRWSDLDLESARVRWRGVSDKLDWEHTTPLSAEAVSVLRAWQRESGALGDLPAFPAPKNPAVPMSRNFARDLWTMLEAAAELPREAGRGWHSLRRAFADELRGQPLKDLTALGGWKDPMTVVRVYQSATLETQREALKQRRRVRIARQL